MASRASHLETAETVLIVPAMHCAGCIAKIEKGLRAMAGVADARVNLTAHQVRIEHDPSLSARDLTSALENLGYASQQQAAEAPVRRSAVRPFLPPLAVAGFAAMNVMLLSTAVWSGADGSTRDIFHWLSALIAVPAVIFAGRPFFVSAWAALRHWQTNMDVPISIGVVLATGLSLYETAVGGGHAWFDGTLMLLLFLLAGRALDAAMRDRARAGVDALLRQAAPGATIVGRDGALTWLEARDLTLGLTMRVAAGERLAADGTIARGSSRFDQSLLTGESTPIPLAQGSEVHAGTLNLDSPVDVTVSATGADTSLAEIARLMEAAGQSRSVYVRAADRAARWYAPAVHTFALASLVGWLLAGAGLHQALVVAIAVLIITCPCALGLAVPVAQVVASGSLMRAGIMVKDGSAIERLAQIDVAMLDKTGTLTLGRPVPDPTALVALTAQEAGVALALASNSRHPLSQSLAQALSMAGHHAPEIDDVREVPGSGVEATWNGRKVSLRRPDRAAGMATLLDIAGEPARLIAFADRLRPDCIEALADLRELGVHAEILSGDNAVAVAEVSRETGLVAKGGVSPADKLAAIATAQAAGHRVLMAGDGLNDGPALAKADASIAPGTASDVGLQAADYVFLGDSLLALPRALRAARSTMRVVRQNFGLAVAYNALALPLAIAGLVTPLVAAIAMSTSSLLVIANSLRLVRAAR